MKRLSLYLITALLTFLLGIATAIIVKNHYYEPPHLEYIPPQDLFYIEVSINWGRISHGLSRPKFIPLHIRPLPEIPDMKTSTAQSSN
jgi:hypothetical protein